MSFRLLSLLGTTLLPTLAEAHEGHGHTSNGLLHYLVEPEHLLGLIAVLVVVGSLAVRYIRHKRG
jgi:hypothetical protein